MVSAVCIQMMLAKELAAEPENSLSVGDYYRWL